MSTLLRYRISSVCAIRWSTHRVCDVPGPIPCWNIKAHDIAAVTCVRIDHDRGVCKNFRTAISHTYKRQEEPSNPIFFPGHKASFCTTTPSSANRVNTPHWLPLSPGASSLWLKLYRESRISSSYSTPDSRPPKPPILHSISHHGRSLSATSPADTSLSTRF
eukprot:scaffold516_cov175-Amphora_coffeaeformis.AAC.11